MRKVRFIKVDKDMCLFDVEGLRIWGQIKKKGGHNGYYVLVDEKGRPVVKISLKDGDRLMEGIRKRLQYTFSLSRAEFLKED